jgi:release factor glutamine methyltransferase
MTIRKLLALGVNKLKPLSPTPRLDSEVLLAHVLGIDRAALPRDRDKEITTSAESNFMSFLERRINREPVHYIVGYREFWSITFRLDHGVLIPRPETELLVERALEILQEGVNGKHNSPVQVADLGTGCGNIAIALASEINDCVIYAIDISQKALECARGNVEDNGLTGKIELLWGDLFEPLFSRKRKLDMIVSNPPYISSEEMKELPPEVREYEPHLALNAGEEGLDYLKRIIDGAPEHLKPGGALVMETGFDQGDAVLQLIEEKGTYMGSKVTQDYAGLDRVVSAFIKS